MTKTRSSINKKQMNKILWAVFFLGAGFLLFLGFTAQAPVGGAFLKPLSDIASSQVSCGGAGTQTTSSLWATPNNLDRVELDNLGSGNVYIAFGSNATTSSGFHLYPVGSSSKSFAVITDRTLLAKGANCVGAQTSTVNIHQF